MILVSVDQGHAQERDLIKIYESQVWKITQVTEHSP